MRADQHRREEGADRREADDASCDQGRDEAWCPPDRRIEQQHHDRQDDHLHAGHERDARSATSLAEGKAAPRSTWRQQEAHRGGSPASRSRSNAAAEGRERARGNASATHRMPAAVPSIGRPLLDEAKRKNQDDWRAKRTASCRRARDSVPRRRGPSAPRATPREGLRSFLRLANQRRDTVPEACRGCPEGRRPVRRADTTLG